MSAQNLERERALSMPIVLVTIAVLLIIAIVVPVSGETIASRFLATLRIARPKAVVAATPGGTPGVGGRQLATTIAGILADTVAVATDSADVTVANADSASRMAGFTVKLIGARNDPTAFRVLGTHGVTVRIKRDQLQTLLVEGGKSTKVPAALEGETVTLKRAVGSRVEYGRCPAPIANTLQNQIQGPPPPSADNGNCVTITQIPLATFTAPAELDTAAVMEIALELTGMSPNQAHDFNTLFDWRAALSLSMPRGTRSYDIVAVAGTKAMRIMTAGRREPAYVLLWQRDGFSYTLAGYGSSSDAIPFAESLR